MNINLDLFTQLIGFSFSAMLIGVTVSFLFDMLGYAVFRIFHIPFMK